MFGEECEFVCVGLNVEGFGVGDEVRGIGFYGDGEVRVFVVDGSGSVDGYVVGDVETEVFCFDSEEELLWGVFDELSEWNPLDTTLLFFDGERWGGGFDVSHLRSRCAVNGVDWVFDGFDCVDASEVVGNKFNVSVPSFRGLNKGPLKEFALLLYEGIDDELGEGEVHPLELGRIECGTKAEIVAEVECGLEGDFGVCEEELLDELLECREDLGEGDLLREVGGLVDVHEVLCGGLGRCDVFADVDGLEFLLEDLVRLRDLRGVVLEYGWNGSFGMDNNIRVNGL